MGGHVAVRLLCAAANRVQHVSCFISFITVDRTPQVSYYMVLPATLSFGSFMTLVGKALPGSCSAASASAESDDAGWNSQTFVLIAVGVSCCVGRVLLAGDFKHVGGHRPNLLLPDYL